MLPALKVLRQARNGKNLVRIGRHRLEDAAVFSIGYVVDVSGIAVLLNKVSDRIDLDGFEVLRLADVTSCARRFPESGFYRRALELKGIQPQLPVAPIDLSTVRTAIRSINEHYPLVVIHREAIEPDECAIGRLALEGEASFTLRWMTPVAKWVADRRRYRYRDITRVEFGSEYENTLALVAGLPVRAVRGVSRMNSSTGPTEPDPIDR